MARCGLWPVGLTQLCLESCASLLDSEGGLNSVAGVDSMDTASERGDARVERTRHCYEQSTRGAHTGERARAPRQAAGAATNKANVASVKALDQSM